MRHFLLLVSVVLTGCSSPTEGNPPAPAPSGTILLQVNGGSESGTYLLDVTTGHRTKIAAIGEPLGVMSASGGYSAEGNFVYGTTGRGPWGIGRLALATGIFDTLLMFPRGHFPAVYDLSRDAQTLAVQVGEYGGLKVYTVHLPTNSWTPHIDAAARVDSLQFGGLRWSQDEQHLYAVTEIFPDGGSQLVRLELRSDRFDILSAEPTFAYAPWLSVAPNGTQIAHGTGEGKVIFRNLSGLPLDQPIPIEPRISRPIYSPDGRFVAFTTYSPDYDSKIEVMRLADGARLSLTNQQSIGGSRALDWF